MAKLIELFAPHWRDHMTLDELRALLRRHEMEWDDRYVWD
jgi:hypothetical protein